jgi:hypothetical protein
MLDVHEVPIEPLERMRLMCIYGFISYVIHFSSTVAASSAKLVNKKWFQ